MRDEIFDVVDEEDRVLGQAPRAEVHARGLRHRAVHVLVFDEEGRVFLQKRSLRKDMHPGVWDSSASGHLAAGEDYDSAAVRELGEELGVVPESPLERRLCLPASPETGNEFIRVYSCTHSGPIRPDPGEIEEGRWIGPDELARWAEQAPGDFSPAFLFVWSRLSGS